MKPRFCDVIDTRPDIFFLLFLTAMFVAAPWFGSPGLFNYLSTQLLGVYIINAGSMVNQRFANTIDTLNDMARERAEADSEDGRCGSSERQE